MELTPKLRAHIDSLSPTDLMRKWRFSPVGDPLFQGESGDYISKRISQISEEDKIKISRAIGW